MHQSTYTNMHRYPVTHKKTYIHTQAHNKIYRNRHILIHRCIGIQEQEKKIQKHNSLNNNKQSPIKIYQNKFKDGNTYIHIYTQRHTHKHTHIYTHTLTHTHTRKHALTQTCTQR